jgi:hypothetical protein
MVKGLDELMGFLLDEIALSGQQGEWAPFLFPEDYPRQRAFLLQVNHTHEVESAAFHIHCLWSSTKRIN